MKKSLFALAALSAMAGTAHADVTLYGILDAGVAELTHAGNFSPTFVTGAVPTGVGNYYHSGTAVGMMNGGEKQTRWGIKGDEDLGDGNKAFFQLESAFSLGTGQLGTSGLSGAATNPTVLANGKTPGYAMVADTSLNNQLFGRNAFIGLSNNEYGAITFGRQNSLELDIITTTAGGYDPVNAQMFSPINFSGFYGGGGATDSARVDNAIKYAKEWGAVKLNAMYGLGGMTGSATTRSTGEFNLGYELNRFGVEFASQEARDTTGIAQDSTNGVVQATFFDLKSYTLALRYQVSNPLTLKAGYQYILKTGPSDVGALSQITQLYGYTIVPLGAVGSTASIFTGGAQQTNVFWFGGNYQLTQKWKLSAGFYDAVTKSENGVAPGADRYG
ncbi:MAG: porin, partial [Ferrovum sp.]|nr:porin [Ferrovum sp.]